MQLEDFGKLPFYIENIYKNKETIRQEEIERIRAIKPPLRRLPEEERYVLLTVSGLKWLNSIICNFSLRVLILRQSFLSTFLTRD